MRVLIVSATLLALQGCGLAPLHRIEDRLTGTVRWVKPGMTQAQFEQDRAACLTEAARAPERSGAAARFQGCMESRGYVRE